MGVVAARRAIFRISDNPIAIAAANGLTKLRTKYGGHYYGPVNASGMVTPDLLFRGGPLQIGDKTYFAGEDIGPYVSQLCIAPTRLGAQPIDQKTPSYAPGINYLTDLDAWYAAQNGKVDGVNVADGVRRHMRNGRALSSYTHIAEISRPILLPIWFWGVQASSETGLTHMAPAEIKSRLARSADRTLQPRSARWRRRH